jgi:hypothetical protein
MKFQLQAAWDQVKARVPQANVAAAPKAGQAHPADDSALLRARLGRMLGLPAAISELELHAANLALTEIVNAADPAEHIEQHRSALPATLGPLILVHLASAWAIADTGLASALENVHRLLVQPQLCSPRLEPSLFR